MTSEHDKRTQGAGLQDEAVALEHAAERLSDRFPEVPKEEIDQLVEERYEQYEDAPIRDFVPVLVEHDVRTELVAETGEVD
ncbi:three-helix bundle dimerization domain-containing protein [Leifsonia sp. EB34]|uniref:three-helix bundle dimerization domain-containing protein n=1 Tax=Leifsonia sp. EB34 TaxID=3156303 RepID=UPI00351724B9